MSSRIKERVKLFLAFRSGGVCAHPECQVRLTQDPAGDDNGVIIGEVAHPYPTQAEVIKRTANAWKKTTFTDSKKRFLSNLFSWSR